MDFDLFMRGLLEKIKHLLLEKASPRIPFAFYAPKAYAVYIDDIHAHKKLAILALLLERDERYIEEARNLLETGPMQMDVDDSGPIMPDGDIITSALMDFLQATHPDCDDCIAKLEEDSQKLDMENFDTYGEKVRELCRFKDMLKGKGYHVDFDDAFPAEHINNHEVCLVLLEDALREPLRRGDEFLIVLEVDGETRALGNGNNPVVTFCIEQCGKQ